MSSVSESNLEKKFQHVSNTQDSIQSFSLWIIHHKSHCKKIVDVWIKILRKTKVSHRLTLLYLANDVIQNAKRKGAAQFAETFYTVFPEATVLLRDDKIRGSVERVFNIWENRNIYSSDAIDELKRILHNTEETSNATSKIISEFKPELLSEKIRKTVKLQLETTSKLSALNASKLDAANSEVLRQFKDRSHGQQFSRDFEEATRCLEEYIGALEREVAERAETIQLLEQAVVYYDTQRGEARIVANAYKSFSNRITVQKKKLEGLKTLLPSPFPSPCADAPSPSNSEEGLDLAATEVPAPAPVLMADDAPSPVGTPEGLQLSPKTLENESAEANLGSDDLKLTPPIISNSTSMPVTSFLGTQGAGLMSSWLDAFNTPLEKSESESKSLLDNKVEDTLDSRLDSRLLNLMQSIPSSVPSALLAGVGGETPVKDEWASAQGTPVQDEDEPSQNDLLKQLTRYNTSSPSQTQWPSALPPNPTNMEPSPDSLKDESVEIRPLLPPPKPSFACLELLTNTPKTSALTVSKSSSDPRLSSQTYTTTSSSTPPGRDTPTTSVPTSTTENSTSTVHHTGRDDNEPMDMDIGESDDDDDNKTSKLDAKNQMNTTCNDDDISVPVSCEREDSPMQKTNLSADHDEFLELNAELDHISGSDEKPTSYSTYRHYSYNRVPENRLTDNKLSDKQSSDNRLHDSEDDQLENRLDEDELLDTMLSEVGRSDKRVSEDVLAEGMITEKRSIETRLSEDLLLESRILDTRLSEKRIPETSAVENRMIDNRLASDVSESTDYMSNRMSDHRLHDNRMGESRLVENRLPEERAPENNRTPGMWKSGEMECSRIETIQTVRNDDWRSPSWDDSPPSSYSYRPQQYPHYRPQMHPYDDRRMYDRPYNELGYSRDFHPPMLGGPKRFQTPPFGGRGNRGYFVQRH